MTDRIYLSTQSQTLLVKHGAAAPAITARYLMESIIPDNNNLEIEINRCFNHEQNRFNTFGSVRLEILFYEKNSFEWDREQITLYGVAENIYFQLQSFTIFCDTRWFEGNNYHAENNYFGSIIIDLSDSSPVITGSSLELTIRTPEGIVSARSSILLRFNSELTPNQSRPVPDTLVCQKIIEKTTGPGQEMEI